MLTGFGDEITADLGRELSVMKTLGLSFTELRAVDGRDVFTYSAKEVAEIRKRLDDAGFRVSSIASPIGKIMIGDDFAPQLEQFKRLLEDARILGVPYMRVFSFYIPKGEPPERYRDAVLGRMERLCDEAKGSGCRLLHENELDLYGDEPERCLDIARSLGRERIGLIFDPANFINLTRRVRIYPDVWHMLKPYVEYIHVKDAVHIDDEKENHHEIRTAGNGEAGFPQILRELRRDGYEGFLSIEPHLGYFPGLEKLEKREIDGSAMAESGPATFRLATEALRALLKTLDESPAEAAGV